MASGETVDEALIERELGESIRAGTDIADTASRALAENGKDAAALKSLLAEMMRTQS